MMLPLLIKINEFLWGYIAIFLLLGVGLYFSFILKLPQVLLLKNALHILLSKSSYSQRSKGAVTSFGAFSLSLAQRVGTGNLAGVATAIFQGGPGAIFWMWMSAFIGASSALVESILAQVFKVQKEDNLFLGGPAFYIEAGLGNKKLASFFAIILVITLGFVFNSVQSNTIIYSFANDILYSRPLFGFLLCVFIAPAIFGGVVRASKIAEKVVPIMAAFYILLVFYALAINYSLLPKIFILIYKDAFNFKAVSGGILGVSINSAMRYGVARGLYSNEAGFGTAPNAAAAAITNHPAEQGLIQMLAVYIDTIIICSATAFLILTAFFKDPLAIDGLSGILLTKAAAKQHFGLLGPYLITIILFLFGITTIVGNSAYGEQNLSFITSSDKAKKIYRVLVLIMVFLGANIDLTLIWEIADMMSGITVVIHIVSILLLLHVAKKTLAHFFDAHKNKEKFSHHVIGLKKNTDHNFFYRS